MKNTLGKLGVWSFIDNYSATEAAEFAQRVEAWGYSALWLPEAVGRDPFSIIGYLAGQTTKLVFATGIANIYARDPMATNAARKTLGELAPGRFILGLGVLIGGIVFLSRAVEPPRQTEVEVLDNSDFQR